MRTLSMQKIKRVEKIANYILRIIDEYDYKRSHNRSDIPMGR